MNLQNQSQKKDLILITEVSGKYFVWNAHHVYNLRTQHRICGALIGSLPRKPWQTNITSLPLILLPEEVHLCCTMGIAKLATAENYFQRKRDRFVDAVEFHKQREENERDQIKLFKFEKMKKEKVFYGLSKKTRRKEKRTLQIQHNDESDTTTQSEGDNEVKNTISETSKIINNARSTESATSFNTQPDDNSEDDWTSITLSDQDFVYYQQAVRVHIPTCAANVNQIAQHEFNYPRTSREKACYRVFKDFWTKGYYVTSASKFGGDYLVYPGDPLRYHSFYIVIVMDTDRHLTSKETICYGRLAASVKKTVVLATVNSDCSSVSCVSLSWTHMKT